jgi:5-(carboxyamino)imidazole ribonucleotide mutase
MTNSTTDVAIIMGSDSDLPIVEAIFPILESFGVSFTKM